MKYKLTKNSYINGVVDNLIYVTDNKAKKEAVTPIGVTAWIMFWLFEETKDESGKSIEKEAEEARGILGDYAASSENEYFAESFAYWINWADNSGKMRNLKNVAPETYEFFRQLSVNNWERSA